MEQQGYEEDLLRRWFPATAEGQVKPLTENDIREIAGVLTRSSRERWCRTPRLYSILRKIGQLDVIDAFIDNDITDALFPFSKSSLPEVLRDHSARLKFLELQHLVYNTEALGLERNARHGHFSDSTEVPLKKVGELGKGGFGYVDRVVSTITHREYARKLILRGRTFRRDKQVLKDFTKELSNLKRLSHEHLVNLIGSYTDKKFVAIIMLPVADTNLQAFLERPSLDDGSRSFLRPFFGCLTSALCYLHDSRLRRKDIKPSNVLIKDDKVYFTDFGTSLDWSGHDNSTKATALPTTARYCAPEVMSFSERNTSSDIWSFGCVFLEMWTVLRHCTLSDLRAYMTAHGTGSMDYHSNLEAATSWIELLQQADGPSCDLIPSIWIMNMLQQNPKSRWNVHTLDNQIGEGSMDPSVQHTFKGLCCLEPEDEESESAGDISDEGLEDEATIRSRLTTGLSTAELFAEVEACVYGNTFPKVEPIGTPLPLALTQNGAPIPSIVVSGRNKPMQLYVEGASSNSDQVAALRPTRDNTSITRKASNTKLEQDRQSSQASLRPPQSSHKEEYDAFIRTQKYKEEEARGKELEELMYKKLTQFGFQDNQIQVLMNPEKHDSQQGRQYWTLP